MGMNPKDFSFIKSLKDEACDQIDCHDVNKKYISGLLSIVSDDRQRIVEEQARTRVDNIALMAAVATSISTIIAVVSLLLTIRANRRSRHNKIQIERLERESERGLA